MSQQQNPKATATATATATDDNKASLTCQQTMYPSTRTFGDGDLSLQYPTGSTAWQCTFSTDGQWLAACFGAPDLDIRLWKRTALVNTVNTADSDDATQKKKHNGDSDNNPTKQQQQQQQQQQQNHNQWEFQNSISGIQERTIRSIAFAPIISPLILASASFDGTICIWEYSNTLKDFDCAAQLEGQESEIKAVAWNGTGSLLASCSRDKTIWIWECFLPGTVGGSNNSSDGGGGDFDCIAVLSSHEGDVKDVKFAPSHGQWGDGDEILLSASYDNTIKCWAEDAGDWYCAASITGVHTSTIWSLTVAPGGGRIISSSGDGSIGILKCYSAAEKQKRFPDEENGRYERQNKLLKSCVLDGKRSRYHTRLMSHWLRHFLVGSPELSCRFPVMTATVCGSVLENCRMRTLCPFTVWTTLLPRQVMVESFQLVVIIEYKYTARHSGVLRTIPYFR